MRVKIGLYVIRVRVGMCGKSYYRMPNGMILSRACTGSREHSVIANGAKIAFRAWFRMTYREDLIGGLKAQVVL